MLSFHSWKSGAISWLPKSDFFFSSSPKKTCFAHSCHEFNTVKCTWLFVHGSCTCTRADTCTGSIKNSCPGQLCIQHWGQDYFEMLVILQAAYPFIPKVIQKRPILSTIIPIASSANRTQSLSITLTWASPLQKSWQKEWRAWKMRSILMMKPC